MRINLFLMLNMLITIHSQSAAADPERLLSEEVAQIERAFAQTMKDRDFESFSGFIDEDAIFIGSQRILQGKEQVTTAWKSYFENKDAPFSWEPETVVILPNEDLALSTGPVKNSSGVITAYFTSTWRKNTEGKWKIIFDKGQKYCPEDKKPRQN